jgi:ferrochelatase
MPQRYSADEVPVQPAAHVGVLLANLGTPAAPTPAAVRRFLAEFLADPMVVDLPRWLWLPLLHGVILNLRPRRSAAAYAKVWTLEGSPLLVESRAQAEGLELALAPRLKGAVRVALGMRYGEPTLAKALAELKQSGVSRLVVLPMYPQYSRTTTGSTHAAVDAALTELAWEPRTTRVLGWHDAPGYIAALASSVRQHWQRVGRGAKLLMSFHGLPARNVAAGDPYAAQCQATAKALAAALDLPGGRWAIAYQSRVGLGAWLTPYTDRTLAGWAAERLGDVDVICPGFSADCLETLEEIAQAEAEAYTGLGGGALRYVPALNSRSDHLAFLGELVAARVAA